MNIIANLKTACVFSEDKSTVAILLINVQNIRRILDIFSKLNNENKF